MAQGSDSDEVINRWCAAVTSGDLPRVRSLVSADVAFVGPRGTGRGADVVVEWVKRSGIQIEPLVITQDGLRYRAECAATWPDPDGPGRTPPTKTILEFELIDGRIATIRRTDHPSE